MKTTTKTLAQTAQLWEILRQSPLVYPLLQLLQTHHPVLYIGAGCIAQTVWNHLYSLPSAHGIKDIDIVYYDDTNTSSAAENETIRAVKATLKACPLPLDIKNQARVHLWYPAHFGQTIAPYQNIRDAIASWPTPATAVAVQLQGRALQVCAPFGLDDLLNGVVRPNKRQITPAIYHKKTGQWGKKWPGLTILPW